MSINMSNPAQSSAFLACIREMKGEREIGRERGRGEGKNGEKGRGRRIGRRVEIKKKRHGLHPLN